MEVNRRQELLDMFTDDKDKKLAEKLVDEVIFLEGKLTELEKLPFIRVNPNNSAQQKTTPAGKLYSQLSGSYNAVLRTLCSLSSKSNSDDESPLRKWVNDHTR